MAKVYKQISELGEIVTGKTPSTVNIALWGGVIPFITPTDINGYDTFYQQATERTISEMLSLNSEFASLSNKAKALESEIEKNLKKLFG